MKTKHLIFLLVVLLVTSIGLSLYLFYPRPPVPTAEIMSGGKVIRTVDLTKNQTFTIPSANGGSNTLEVKDGAICVTEASCPDHVCMAFGWCSSGMPIVCLPNEMMVVFPANAEMDSVSG